MKKDMHIGAGQPRSEADSPPQGGSRKPKTAYIRQIYIIQAIIMDIFASGCSLGTLRELICYLHHVFMMLYYLTPPTFDQGNDYGSNCE